MNIALAAVGRRVELVRAFQRAQLRPGLEGRTIGLDCDSLAPGLRACDQAHIVPRLDDDGFVPALIEICRRERVDLLFPLIDPMIEVLAEHRIVLESQGTRAMVVSAESAKIAADKLLTHQFFQDLKLPTPRTWLPEELDPEMAPYPLFIKPRRGSASQHAYKIRDTRELLFFRDYVPNSIVQQFAAGPEITSDVICDHLGTVLGIVSRRRIEVRSGEVSKGCTVHDPRIDAGCMKIAKALPAVGPITVQCLLHEGEPLFTEVNARLGGGLPLAIAAGFDVPAMLLSAAANIRFDVPAPGHYETGLYMTRFDDSFFLKKTELLRSESPAAIRGPVGN